jgi:hypothetical protein
MHQTIGKTIIKLLNCVDSGCLRRKGKVVAVHAIRVYGAAEV